MTRQDPITISGDIANGSDLIVDGSGGATGAIDVFELGGEASADVFREVDTTGDGTFNVSVAIESTTSPWHSQDNRLTVSQAENTRIRITNTSGSSASYYAAGFEVPDGA